MPQNEAKTGEAPFFAALYADPQRLTEFLRSMSGLSRQANLAIARQFPWKDYATYADVGTAQGDLAAQIALKYPHLSGTGFDLPEVEPILEEYMTQNQLAERVTFVGGDFFTDPFPKTDVVLMGHILHDWNLEEKMIVARWHSSVGADNGTESRYGKILKAASRTSRRVLPATAVRHWLPGVIGGARPAWNADIPTSRGLQ